MITFKQFIAEKSMTVYHSTNDAGLDSIETRGFRPQPNENRLFPGTVSFTFYKNGYGGKHVIQAKLDVEESDILRLSMKDFWSKAGDGKVTPIELGKRWVADAKEQGKKVIVLKGVPSIGTEVAVLDVDAIGATSKVKP